MSDKGIIIDIGFRADVKDVVDSIEKQFQNIDFGEMINLSTAFDTQEKEVKKRLKELKTLIDNTIGGTTPSNAGGQLKALNSAVGALSKSFLALFKILPQSETSQYSAVIDEITQSITGLSSICSNAVDSVNDLSNSVSHVDNIQFVDRDQEERLLSSYKILERASQAADNFGRSIRKNGNKRFDDEEEVLDKLYHTYVNYLDIQGQIEDLDKKDVFSLEDQKQYDILQAQLLQTITLMSRYSQTYQELSKNNRPSDLLPLPGKDTTFEELNEILEEQLDDLHDYINRRQAEIKTAYAAFGGDLSDFDKLFEQSVAKSEKIKIPIALDDGSKKKLYNDALALINSIQDDLAETPLEIEVKLVSSFLSKKNKALLSEIRNELNNIGDNEITTQLSGYLDKMEKSVGNALMFTVDINSSKATSALHEFIEAAKEELEILEKYTIYPDIQLTEESKQDFKDQLDKLQEGIIVDVKIADSDAEGSDETLESNVKEKFKTLRELKQYVKQLENALKSVQQGIDTINNPDIAQSIRGSVVLDELSNQLDFLVEKVDITTQEFKHLYNLFQGDSKTQEEIEGLINNPNLAQISTIKELISKMLGENIDIPDEYKQRMKNSIGELTNDIRQMLSVAPITSWSRTFITELQKIGHEFRLLFGTNDLTDMINSWIEGDKIKLANNNIDSPLRERSAVIGDDGRIYGASAYDNPTSTGLIWQTIKELRKKGVSSKIAIHSHPNQYAGMSWGMSGDFLADMQQWLQAEVEKHLVVAGNDIQIFDAQNFARANPGVSFTSTHFMEIMEKYADQVRDMYHKNVGTNGYEGKMNTSQNVSRLQEFFDGLDETYLEAVFGENGFGPAFKDFKWEDLFESVMSVAKEGQQTTLHKILKQGMQNKFSEYRPQGGFSEANKDALKRLGEYLEEEFFQYYWKIAGPSAMDSAMITYYDELGKDYSLDQLFSNFVTNYTPQEFAQKNPLNIPEGLLQNLQSSFSGAELSPNGLGSLVETLRELKTALGPDGLKISIDDSKSKDFLQQVDSLIVKLEGLPELISQSFVQASADIAQNSTKILTDGIDAQIKALAEKMDSIFSIAPITTWSSTFKEELRSISQSFQNLFGENELTKMINGWIEGDKIKLANGNINSPLRERSAVIGDDGKIYGSYAFDEEHSSGLIWETIKELEKRGIRSKVGIHSHPSQFAGLSWGEEGPRGDFKADMSQWLREQVEKSLIVAGNDIQVHDIKGFQEANPNIDFSSQDFEDILKYYNDKLRATFRVNVGRSGYPGKMNSDTNLQLLGKFFEKLDFSYLDGAIGKDGKLDHDIQGFDWRVIFDEILQYAKDGKETSLKGILEGGFQRWASNLAPYTAMWLQESGLNSERFVDYLSKEYFQFFWRETSPKTIDKAMISYLQKISPDTEIDKNTLYSKFVTNYTPQEFAQKNPLNLTSGSFQSLLRNNVFPEVDNLVQTLQRTLNGGRGDIPSISIDNQSLQIFTEDINQLIAQLKTLPQLITEAFEKFRTQTPKSRLEELKEEIQAINEELEKVKTEKDKYLNEGQNNLGNQEKNDSPVTEFKSKSPKPPIPSNVDENIKKFDERIEQLEKELASKIKEAQALISTLGINPSNINPGNFSNDLKKEAESLESLKRKILEVRDAVNLKTEAFKQEAKVVKETVNGEIETLDPLENLSNTFDIYKGFYDKGEQDTEAGFRAALAYYNAYKEAILARVNKKELSKFTIGKTNDLFTGNYAEYKKGIGSLDLSGLNGQIDLFAKRVSAFDGVDASVSALAIAIQKLVESASGSAEATALLQNLNKTITNLAGNKSSEKIQQFTDNLQRIKDSFNNFKIKDHSFLDGLNNILSKSQELRDFAKIISQTEKKIQDAGKATGGKGVDNTAIAEQNLLQYSDKIQANLSAMWGNNGSTSIDTKMKATKSGLIEIVALLREANGAYKEYTYTTANGDTFGVSKIVQDSVSIDKRVKAYEAYQKMLANYIGRDNIGSVTFTPNDPGWQELIDLAQAYQIELEDIGKIIQTVDHGVESFQFFSADGTKRTTLGINSKEILYQKNLIVDVIGLLDQFKQQVNSLNSSAGKAMKGSDLALEDFIASLKTAFETIEKLSSAYSMGLISKEQMSDVKAYYNSFITTFKNFSLDKIDTTGRTQSFLDMFDSAEAQFKQDITPILQKVVNGAHIENNDIANIRAFTQSLRDLYDLMGEKSSKLVKTSTLYKTLRNMESELNKNSRMSKEYKEQIHSLIFELEKYGELAPEDVVKRIQDQFTKLQYEIQKAGKIGLSVADRFKNKVTDSFAQFWAQFFSINDWIRYFRTGIQYVTELDSALVQLSVVSGETGSGLKQISSQAFDVAQEIGSSTTEVINSITSWRRLGYSINEATELAKQASILSTGGFMDNEVATEALTSSLQAFDEITTDNLSVAVDDFIYVGNNFAISSEELATSLEKSSAALVAAGNSFNETQALEVAGNTILQDADTVSNSLKVLSMRLRGTTASALEQAGEDTEGVIEDASKLYETIKELTKVQSNPEGVSIINKETQAYKSTYEILLEISKVFDELSDAQKAGLLETIAGKTRASAAAAILQNGDILSQVYNDLELGKAAGAGEKALETSMDSIEKRVILFQNQLKELVNGLVDSDLVKEVVDLGTEGLKTVDQFAKIVGPALELVINPLIQILEIVNQIISALGPWGTTGLMGALFGGKKIFGRDKKLSLFYCKNLYAEACVILSGNTILGTRYVKLCFYYIETWYLCIKTSNMV